MTKIVSDEERGGCFFVIDHSMVLVETTSGRECNTMTAKMVETPHNNLSSIVSCHHRSGFLFRKEKDIY